MELFGYVAVMIVCLYVAIIIGLGVFQSRTIALIGIASALIWPLAFMLGAFLCAAWLIIIIIDEIMGTYFKPL